MRILLFQNHPSYRFIADFASDFAQAGHTVEWLPYSEGPHIPSHLRRFGPDFLFCVGASPAVAKAVAGRVPVVYYELDKVLNLSLWDGAPAGGQDVVFTTYRDDMATFRDFGFRHAHYLPFCPNISRTCWNTAEPFATPPREYGIAFVGSILRERTNDYRTMLTHARRHLPEGSRRREMFERLAVHLELLLSEQDQLIPLNEYTVSNAVSTLPNWALEATREFGLSPMAIAGILAKEVAHRQRLFWLGYLPAVDLWSPDAPGISSPFISYRGEIDQYTGSGPVFARSAANINIQRLYARDGLSDRVFNVLAAGGCLLADANPAIVELFEPDKEVLLFSSPEELRAQASHVLHDRALRHRIAERGHRCLRSRHLFRHRIHEIISRLPGRAATVPGQSSLIAHDASAAPTSRRFANHTSVPALGSLPSPSARAQAPAENFV